MALMLSSLYDALRAADVDEEIARKAAEEVAGFDTRLAKVESDLTLLKWMVSTAVALILALGFGNLWLSFNILSRLPR